MGDSMAERMDAGWQAARYWETECEAAISERDAYLEIIRATFDVLAARGQAPDDNAPLEVTVRRVLDYLDKVTAERDNLKARVELLEAYSRADATSALYVGTERDALAAQLATLKKRLSDAERITVEEVFRGRRTVTITAPAGTYALVRLEDGE